MKSNSSNFKFFLSPPDKLAFVGFKGSFRPDWVRMSVDEERAKLHQVLPIPVIKMMKLWRRAAHSRTSQTRSSTTASFARTTEPKPPIRTEHVFMLPSNPSKQIPLCVTTWIWQRDFWIVSSVDYTWVSTGEKTRKKKTKDKLNIPCFRPSRWCLPSCYNICFFLNM